MQNKPGDQAIPSRRTDGQRKGYFERVVSERFANSGVCINGGQPFDIQVHDRRFFRRLVVEGSLGFGESYMDGWWDCEQLDELVCRLFLGGVGDDRNYKVTVGRAVARLVNLQSRRRSKMACEEHYDLGNDLYRDMLSSEMAYSCGYWDNAQTLEQAQFAKLDLICRKLDLEPGMHLLDIGCGFGSLMKHAATHYGVRATGYTLSNEQVTLGRELCRDLPIEFVVDDYRNITGQFDRVASVGMLEAVGHKNFKEYFEVVSKALDDAGVAVIHTVGNTETRIAPDPWVHKYIFRNGMLPSVEQLAKSITGLFVLEDWHCLASDNYPKTLFHWHKRFQLAWPKLSRIYDERFRRMWTFYLLAGSAGFRARRWHVWQLVLSKLQSGRLGSSVR